MAEKQASDALPGTKKLNGDLSQKPKWKLGLLNVTVAVCTEKTPIKNPTAIKFNQNDKHAE